MRQPDKHGVRLSASGVALARACGYAFREDVELPPQAKSGASSRGNAFGLLAEHEINGGECPPISELVAGLSETEGENLVAMWGHAKAWLGERKRLGWRAEVAFAYDLATDKAREIPRTAHRDYSSATATEVCGTADIAYVDGDGIAWILDWKTQGEGAPDLDATDQLETLALMAARAWGCDEARIAKLRVTTEGVFPSEPVTLGFFELIEIAARLRGIASRIPDAEPCVGDHCTERYCRAITVCPKQTSAMVQLVPDVALARKEWRYQPVIESPDHLAHMLSLRPLIRKACEQVDAANEAYVADGPVATSDGRVIKQAFRTMPRMNQSALLDLAKRRGATDDEISACVRQSVESNGVRISGGPKRGRAA